MELRTLGGDFVENDVIDTYKSLIWTERYRLAGDFRLTTYDIGRTMTKMPLASMCRIKDAKDCMWVESHVVDKDPDGEYYLTVSGRSWETFFENRVAHEGQARMFTLDGDPEGPQPPNYDYNLATTGEAASKYAYEMIRYKTMISSDTVNYIPNLACTVASNATLAGGKPRRYMTIKIGNLYERVLECLEMDDLGIRCILPTTGVTLTVNIYAGTDVSTDVILSASSGHFSKTQYAWSIRDYKNAAIAHSEWDWTYSAGSSGSGLGRRIGWVDAGDITHKNAPSLGSNIDEKELQSRIARFLKANKQTTLFSGEVAYDIPYKFLTHYNLGDILLVDGDYGLSQKMRVVEYTRIQDDEGERAYPTLDYP